MKKRNLFFASAMLFAVVAFFSCSSSPEEQLLSVNPLELLDGESTFYLSFAPDADKEITQRIIDKYFANAAAQASQIVSRVSTVYAGVYNYRNSSYVQIAAYGDVPQNASRMIFRKRDGWEENSFTVRSQFPGSGDMAASATETVYSSYSNVSLTDMQIALPSHKIACVAQDVSSMVCRYDALARGADYDGGPNLSRDAVEWLSGQSKEIRFYAVNPLSFLTILTGSSLNLQLDFVKATMVSDPRRKDGYLLGLEFEFLDERVVSAGQAMLTLAFGLSNARVSRKSPTNLSITGIEMQKKQLFRLLSL